ncbi:serine/threonine-protein kinase [Actinoplanes sp. NPDC051851]|uniref:serine/threonine protein kinase n=1 Tax=Actinoplanes sp. NPDC051851 TaxID=3154753 RepID=UPI0034216DFA
MGDSTEPGAHGQPLRPADPSRLGDYELIGRLGEGGMGTVYLARTGSGVLVAVKMVRADLAHDDEFRRRFRSEVDRARQVPPFCTAEVLDADPDHEHPYLVVEFVDGPTLAKVVEEKGPLTASNLHGVAIGVATALTAIHGAGVIHRDLKPRNVLLAPGSPKVIDFGIARAMEATSANTRTDQMVGTVAYMAPERFSTEGDTPVTPAADVFAWGSVVAYAGTGRTPFNADSPPATAARILTQPPRLDGLSAPLRDLVAHALEKDPANRPSSRELLDLLISGPRPAAATAAAFAKQPDLRAAAVEAQAVTGYAPTLDIPPGLVGYDENSIITVPISETTKGAPPPVPVLPARRRRRWVPAAALVAVVAVAAGVLLAVMSTGQESGAAPAPGVSSSPAEVLIEDGLRQKSLWIPSEQASEKASCAFDGALIARRGTSGTYRCNGPLDQMPADLSAEVGVRLVTPDSCAAIWFRFQDLRGYQARVCERNVYVGIHRRDGTITVLRTFVLADPIALDAAPTRIGLRVAGNTVEILREGAPIGTAELTEPTFTGGRIVLGVFNERDAPEKGPYEVAFTDIKIWR